MRPPDLIVLDVMLPDGDGFLFAKKLRRNSAVPIISSREDLGIG
jgi:DNA-binding response OmpR family regulator